MGFLTGILYFLLFILFISTLIVIHELGHLTMAKVFKVYCLEFSIGVGPALFSRKGKSGETKYSLRAIPFGGYVSMYSEGVELEDGVVVEPSRSLEGIKKWKKAIIMSAGVVMNCLTALIIFFITAWIPQNKFAPNAFTVNAATSTELHLAQGDYAFASENLGSNVFAVDKNAIVHYNDSTEQNNVIAALNYSNFTFKKTAIHDYLEFYTPMTQTDEDGNTFVVISKNNEINIAKVDYVEFSFSLASRDEQGNEITTKLPIKLDKKYDAVKEEYSYEDLKLKVYTIAENCGNLGNAIKQTFTDFGEASTIVVTSLKTLLTDTSSWGQAGGIVAVGFVTSQTLENYGWNYFLYYWGVISVNLAIINILPFPGLDGWHLLILAVEGIARRPIPNKVKNVVAFIGLAILFTLMILLLFKDVFTFVF